MRENLATFPDKASSLKLERGINTHTKRRGGTRMRCNGRPRHCNQMQELQQQPLPSRFGDVRVPFFFFFLHLKDLLNHCVARTDNHM